MSRAEPESHEESLRRELHTELMAAISDQTAVTLSFPHLEYQGSSAAGPEFTMTQWHADVVLYADDEGESEPTPVKVGYLEIWTVPVDGYLAETLDAISVDSAEYLALLDEDEIADDVLEQFHDPFITGLLILNRAYIHPALRGHDLAPWAVIQAVRQLTFGSTTVLVVAYPTPTEDRPGSTAPTGANRLTQHWHKAGLELITACPKLVGQVTASDFFDGARNDVLGAEAFQITVSLRDDVQTLPKPFGHNNQN